MAWVTAVLFLSVAASLSRASNIDIISRLDRSLIPYSGAGSASSPYRRYRYPIYTKRALVDDGDEQDYDAEDVSKRFLRGMNLRPLSLGVRDKRLRGLTPRYDISMTPYDLKAMAKLYENGRRKRTPDLYDLKRIYKIYEAGRKRSISGSGRAKKASADFGRDVWDLTRMADAGKRSPVTSYYDLLDIARMNKAGKRAPQDDFNLWELARLEEAGKRSADSYDLLSLAQLADAGKRSGRHAFGPEFAGSLHGLYDRRSEGDSDDAEDAVDAEQRDEKKRSFDDFFGWDRKKKANVEDTLSGNYFDTLKSEVAEKADKRDGSVGMDMVMKKADQGNED